MFDFELAMRQFRVRRAANAKQKKIKNENLPAGSPMSMVRRAHRGPERAAYLRPEDDLRRLPTTARSRFDPGENRPSWIRLHRAMREGNGIARNARSQISPLLAAEVAKVAKNPAHASRVDAHQSWGAAARSWHWIGREVMAGPRGTTPSRGWPGLGMDKRGQGMVPARRMGEDRVPDLALGQGNRGHVPSGLNFFPFE